MKPILMQTFTETLTRVDGKDGSIVFKKTKLFVCLFVYLSFIDNANIIHNYIILYYIIIL